jgi:eukaryotic-like serine/threonine-protein kinase
MNVETGDDRRVSGSKSAAPRAPAASRVGQVVGDRWRLESLIGFGGTASVYAARHRNGGQAALKVLHPELARDAHSRRRFLREAYAANRVGHPGAVAVIDDGTMPDGIPFLLLELIEGKPLTAFVDEGARLPVSEVVAIGAGILDVLAAAHDAGVVHRDIKPSNVIVTADRRVKVLDFGIAKFHDAAEHDPLVTRSEAALGTPAFMSPEQSAGRSAEVDARSDLWSLGATLFALLTGRFVHAGTTANELLIASATVPARSVASLRDDLPPSVVSAIDRALSLDRAKRWPNARAMKATLTGTLDDDPASVTTIPETALPGVRRRRPSWLPALGAGGVLVMATFAWLAFLRPAAGDTSRARAPVSAARAPAPELALPSARASLPDPRASSAEPPPRGPIEERMLTAAPRREAPAKVRAASSNLAGASSPAADTSTRVVPRINDALFDRRQ